MIRIKGPYASVSRKDLKNLAWYLKSYESRRQRTYKDSSKRINHLITHQEPIPYRFHLKGVSHRPGLGPGRTPMKCYRYLQQVFKCQKGLLDKTLTMKLHRVLIQGSTSKLRGGYRRASRGRAYPTERKKHRVVLEYE